MTILKDNFLEITKSKDFQKIKKELKKLDPDIIRSNYNSFRNYELTLDPFIVCEGLGI